MHGAAELTQICNKCCGVAFQELEKRGIPVRSHLRHQDGEVDPEAGYFNSGGVRSLDRRSVGLRMALLQMRVRL